MTTTTSDTVAASLGQLTRLEIRRYLRHPLYWVGLAFLVLSVVGTAGSADTDGSPLSAPIAPALTLGVFGLVIAAQLARSADRVGESAGAPPVPERIRTLALAGSYVVPVVTALAWLVAFLAIYGGRVRSSAWWFDDLSAVHVLAVLIGTGVVAALGGPALGLLVARWVPWRAAPLLAAVLLVVLGAITQAGSGFPPVARLFYPWTQWAAGVTDHQALYLPGNPVAWLVYALALCTLAVLAAVRHDADAARPRLRLAAAVTGLLAVVALVLSMTTGAADERKLPVPDKADAASGTALSTPAVPSSSIVPGR